MAAQAANLFQSSLPATVFESRPFLRLMAASASRIAPDTHQDQASARPGLALAARPPQKNVGTAPHPKEFHSIHGCRLAGANLRMAYGAGDPLATAAGDGDPASNSVQLVATPVTVPGSPDRRLSFRRSSALHRTACPPSGCGSRRARACAPTPWWRRYCWSWPSCARRSAWPRGSSGCAKLAASTNAQARYLLPFLTLPSPFFLRLLVCTLSTQRA